MADAGGRHEKNLAGGAADLRGEVGVTAELAVAVVDLADGFDEVDAHHEGRAARELDGDGFAGNGARGATGRWEAGCRAGVRGAPRSSSSNGQTAAASELASERVGERGDGGRLELGIVVEEEYVLGVSGAPSQVESLW